MTELRYRRFNARIASAGVGVLSAYFIVEVSPLLGAAALLIGVPFTTLIGVDFKENDNGTDTKRST